MIKRVVAFFVALAAMCAAAGVLVVAAAYALYALVRDYVGPAGAAAIDCAAAAVLIGLLALVAWSQVRFPKAKPKTGGSAAAAPGKGAGGLGDRLAEVVRERPMVAASAAAAAGLLAWRNPVLVSTLLRLLDPPGAKKRKP